MLSMPRRTEPSATRSVSLALQWRRSTWTRSSRSVRRTCQDLIVTAKKTLLARTLNQSHTPCAKSLGPLTAIWCARRSRQDLATISHLIWSAQELHHLFSALLSRTLSPSLLTVSVRQSSNHLLWQPTRSKTRSTRISTQFALTLEPQGSVTTRRTSSMTNGTLTELPISLALVAMPASQTSAASTEHDKRLVRVTDPFSGALFQMQVTDLTIIAECCRFGWGAPPMALIGAPIKLKLSREQDKLGIFHCKW